MRLSVQPAGGVFASAGGLSEKAGMRNRRGDGIESVLTQGASVDIMGTNERLFGEETEVPTWQKRKPFFSVPIAVMKVPNGREGARPAVLGIPWKSI